MCYLLQLKKEETQGHILSLLCCLRAGSQHLVVSLTWEISGGLGQHDNTVPGKYWRFSFPRGGQRWASVPCGSAVGLAKEEPAWSHSEFFLRRPRELPKKSHQEKLWHRPSKNKGRGERVSQRQTQNTAGEPWSEVPSREGTDRFRDTPVRKWFSSQYPF